MSYLLHTYKIVLLLLSTCLLSIEVTSTQEGSSYFFYQQPEYPRDCKEARDQCSSDNYSGVYTIKPNGYPQPFEVYCNNKYSSGGWTVIQRRIDESLTFKRNWEDFKSGFGFLSSEFWIGNDRLSYLTNQALYELRIDMTLSNGSSFYVKYNSFRISDEWSNYAIVTAEEFMGNSSCVVSTCPSNMTHDGCRCQRLCSDPIGMTDCDDNCVETCVPDGCFVPDTNSIISNGETYVNSDCSQRCTCNNNQLNCNNYECSLDATCSEQDGVTKCYCNDGFEGDGENCTATLTFTDCNDVYDAGHTQDGVYSIHPAGWTGSPFDVFCNMTIDGGRWTVFQRRVDGTTDFYRNWAAYRDGFGDIQNEFWIGNEQLHYLTQQATYEYRVDFVYSSSSYYHKYSRFRIDDETNKYKVTDVGTRSGTRGGSLYRTQNIAFSTYDQDNDGKSSTNCAEGHRSGWWHGGYYYSDSASLCWSFPEGSAHRYCSFTNLNGDFNGGNGKNIFDLGGGYYDCHIKYTEMKIRRTS